MTVMTSTSPTGGVGFGRARVAPPTRSSVADDRDYDDPAVVAANLRAAFERARGRLRRAERPPR
jgi:hypothetical protein